MTKKLLFLAFKGDGALIGDFSALFLSGLGRESFYETKTALVIYDDEIADVELLTEATSNAGYPSTIVTPDV